MAASSSAERPAGAAWTIHDLCEALERAGTLREKALLCLWWDTGLSPLVLACIDLDRVDLDRGQHAHGDTDYLLSQFTIDAVAACREGGDA